MHKMLKPKGWSVRSIRLQKDEETDTPLKIQIPLNLKQTRAPEIPASQISISDQTKQNQQVIGHGALPKWQIWRWW